jgi:hypothetical protein
MRHVAILIAAAVLTGCGNSSATHTASTPATQPAKSTAPKYFPSAHHAHRPPGFVYDDEIGENVLTAPYDRVIELFGPPASKQGDCIHYRIVRQPKQQWEFCFRGQTMTGAMVIPAG